MLVGFRMFWLYPLQRDVTQPETGILGMTLNCIWEWGSSSGEWSTPSITLLPGPCWAIVVVSSMGQISQKKSRNRLLVSLLKIIQLLLKLKKKYLFALFCFALPKKETRNKNYFLEIFILHLKKAREYTCWIVKGKHFKITCCRLSFSILHFLN